MSKSRNPTIKERFAPGSSLQRLRIGIVVLSMTIVIGTAGYVIAGWEWLDAIYMVIITIFGVGYGEVRPVNDPSIKLFTILLIISGCTSGIFVVGGILQLITEGEIRHMMGQHNREREIEALRDHAIICGYGRVGKILAYQLNAAGDRFVVIDREQERADEALQDGFLALCGDAVEDSTLEQAGIAHARALTTVLPNDAINVFITLTARDLNEDIHLIARAEAPATERKLIRSGADRVVMPAAIGAVRIAQLVGNLGTEADESSELDARPKTGLPESASIDTISGQKEIADLQSLHDDIVATNIDIGARCRVGRVEEPTA